MYVAAPPSAFSIAGQMIGGAARSTAAKIVGIVLASLVGVGMVVAGISSGPGAAVGALLISILVLGVIGFMLAFPTLIVVFIIASGRARSAESGAMQGYAGARRLTYSPSGTLVESTPLLSAGSSRQTQDVMTGLLPGGLQGTLAHYTFYVRHSSGQQGSQRVPYEQTVVIALLPETAPRVRRLLCHGGTRLSQANLFGLDLSGDAEVELESAALNERYRIRTGSGQDQAWLRELFTPVFIDWLASSAVKGFSFELVDGLLCVSVSERFDTPTDLDWLCGAAAYVAGRLRAEVAEEAG
jgi:hypothetical protein